MIGIYKITNIINNKSYIGQSINIDKRLYEHKYKAFYKTDRSYNSAIHPAFRKYGIENFSFEILEECLLEELDEKEKYYIQKYNSLIPNGYNILIGGQGIRKEEPKLFFCLNCEKQITKEAKTNLCPTCYQLTQRKADRPEPIELAKLIKENGFEATGRLFNVSGNSIKKWCKDFQIPHTKEELIYWYNKQVGIVNIKKEKEKEIINRPVYQIDKNTDEIISSYNSVAEAARSLGKQKESHICEVCNGIHKTAYGFKWRYIDQDIK